MTEAATREKRRHRSPNGPGLFVTDQELIEILGIPEREARQAIAALDHDPRSGFPPKKPLWGGRRYYPAVRAYLDSTLGFGGGNVQNIDARRRKKA